LNENSAEATPENPLTQFLEYRDEFGMDTAREDMEDNGFIDNSIYAAKFEDIESENLPNNVIENAGNNLLITRTAPDSAAQFFYHWEGDNFSVSEYSSYINEPLKIIFLDEKIIIPDNSASEKLLNIYGILLSNEDVEWQLENSFAILEMMGTIPQVTTNSKNSVTSKWILTNDHIDDDIKITQDESITVVRISMDAFENANPKIAQTDDKKGSYFSKRLHHALVWFVTDEGSDLKAIEYILNKRFNVSVNIPDYNKLTESTTSESEKSFQKFHPRELIEIINTFEEMPEGFHSIEGLDYLVRRADGTSHPLHPGTPAIAWASIGSGYIEFMETAFTGNEDYLHRLIIHEKSHFLWQNLFSNDLKDEWTNLGGWYKDVRTSDWATSKTTEFASAYAHLKNPEEDMAESIAYFIFDPDKLKSRALPKYEFIKDTIMEGNIYLTEFREDLTFDVLNLYPDYIYPGKIIRVDISIEGKEYEKKHATIEIEISGKDKFEGAKSANLRIYSESRTYKDITLRPVDDFGFVLRGEVTLNEFAKNGLWYTKQITITDQNGNKRFQGQNDFGWKFFVNNPNEDIIAPKYVEDSLELTKRDGGSLQRPVQTITATWEVDDNSESISCYATIDHESLESYSVGSWGNFDTQSNQCSAKFNITEYGRSGNYMVQQLKMIDAGGNSGTVGKKVLSDDYFIFVETSNEDVIPPHLDINNIEITSTPTNPINPNGETEIKIVFYAYDDKSGLGKVSYILQDPQGIKHNYYYYHSNFHSLFFEGVPDESKRYDVNLILPVGSVPGKWGLVSISLKDKAYNGEYYRFTEVIHFET